MPQAALWGSAVTLHHTMKSLEEDSLQGKTLLVFEEESEKRNPYFDEHSFKNSQQKIQLFFTIKYFHESSLAHGYTEDETDTRRQASLGSKAFFTHCR